MKMSVAVLGAVCAMLIALPLAAETMNSTTSMNSSMNLKDAPPPVVPEGPIILGEVVDMTSHSVRVRTARDEQMVFEYDSRTVMPMQLPSGRRVKVEWNLTEDGLHHAGRITPIEHGSFDWSRLDHQLAEAEMYRRAHENEPMAHNESMNGSATERNEDNRNVNGNDNNPSSNASNTNQERNEDELPRTASTQPWLLVFGVAAIALGLGIAFARRRRVV